MASTTCCQRASSRSPTATEVFCSRQTNGYSSKKRFKPGGGVEIRAESPTSMPPNGPFLPETAPTGTATGTSSCPSTRAKVACCTVTGTAGSICCAMRKRSLPEPPCATASNSQVSEVTPSGASAVQTSSAALSASNFTSLLSSARSPALLTVLADTLTVIGLAVPLRTVSKAL